MMNPYFQKQLVIGFFLFAGWATTICAQNESIDATAPRQAAKVWRGGWLNRHKEKDPQVLVDTARKLGFSALMINAGDDFPYLNDLCERARKAHIDIYYSFLITGTPKNKDWWQVVSPADAEKLRRIKEDKSPEKNGYQYGGEPINDQTDIHETEFLCFHRPEVLEYSSKKLEDVLQKCPGLAGIAFDFFGYKNYRSCECPVSEKMFEDYLKQNELPRTEALEQFSLDTLVDFNNRLADHCRKLKPGIKIATHVYPTFIPEPVYGNRLDVDYCMQTVAWFFKPFWDSAKVEDYTRKVVQDEKRYFARAQGIPFVGIYMDKPNPAMNKPAERFREELRSIRKAGSRSFGISPFNIFITHPELGDILIEELGLPETAAGS
jgi:hypothetical protein